MYLFFILILFCKIFIYVSSCFEWYSYKKTSRIERTTTNYIKCKQVGDKPGLIYLQVFLHEIWVLLEHPG